VGSHYFHHLALKRAREELVKNGRSHDSLIAIPELRDRLATSRRYMIPLLEHFDSIGLTVRRGDKRYLRESKLEEGR
jgi:selenocysteine-specific elongation factor